MAISVPGAVGERFEANRALIDAAESMTPDEIHQHPMAALDKMRALARELRATQPVHEPRIEPSGIPFHDQKMRELDDVRLAHDGLPDARVLHEAIQSALSKLRHFPNNGVDRDLRAALAAVSDPQRRNGE